MLIAKRNNLGGAIPVPYDAELQYAIKSVYGTKGLVIQFKPTEKTSYELKYRYLDRTKGRNLFGSRDSATVANVSQTIQTMDFGNYSQTRLGTGDFATGDDLVYRNSANERSIEKNGEIISRSTNKYTGPAFIGTYDAVLGGVGGLDNYGAEGFYYYCKIWDDGVLLFDLIPVRVGNLMYWYNKATRSLMDYCGAFTVGPDKISNGGGV